MNLVMKKSFSETFMRKSGICIQPEILGSSTLLATKFVISSHFIKLLIKEKSIKTCSCEGDDNDPYL